MLWDQPGVVFDLSRNPVIIIHHIAGVYAFNIQTGELIGKFRTIGPLSYGGEPIYDDGRVFLTAYESFPEQDEHERDYWILEYVTHLHPPNVVQYPSVSPLLRKNIGFFSLTTEKRAKLSSRRKEPLKLHSWDAESLQDNDDCDIPPTETIEIPISFPRAFYIRMEHSGVAVTVFCMQEPCEFSHAPGSHQSLLHLHQVPSLEILWTSSFIEGPIGQMYYIPDRHVIFAEGHKGIDWPEADFGWVYARILALDATDGKRLQYVEYGGALGEDNLESCRLKTVGTDKGKVAVSEDSDIVWWTKCGDVLTYPLSRFLDHGLPPKDFRPLKRRLGPEQLPEDFPECDGMRAGNRCVVLGGGEGKLAVIVTW
ncbi:hypothetical protein L218DRAFT_1077436 [Marasmius fiardii PR-910]|nr:hypothetical protein L218DRAFT_1077436 [Marasmius fiardii PR-910]